MYSGRKFKPLRYNNIPWLILPPTKPMFRPRSKSCTRSVTVEPVITKQTSEKSFLTNTDVTFSEAEQNEIDKAISQGKIIDAIKSVQQINVLVRDEKSIVNLNFGYQTSNEFALPPTPPSQKLLERSDSLISKDGEFPDISVEDYINSNEKTAKKKESERIYDEEDHETLRNQVWLYCNKDKCSTHIPVSDFDADLHGKTACIKSSYGRRRLLKAISSVTDESYHEIEYPDTRLTTANNVCAEHFQTYLDNERFWSGKDSVTSKFHQVQD